MKKIFIVAGAIFLFVLLLSAWLFIIDFGNFAQTLGGGVGDILLDEKIKFIGTWETTYLEDDDRFVGYNGIYMFSSDGTGLIGGLSCTWDIVDSKLIIRYYEGFATLTYDYSFSDDVITLSLNDYKGTLDFTKKLS